MSNEMGTTEAPTESGYYWWHSDLICEYEWLLCKVTIRQHVRPTFVAEFFGGARHTLVWGTWIKCNVPDRYTSEKAQLAKKIKDCEDV